MKFTPLFLFLFLIFNSSNAQVLNATLVELNFHTDSYPQQFTRFQSGFYFTATDGYWGKYGRELWYSDGTPEGTKMVKDINPGGNSADISSLTIVGDVLFFTANDGTHGTELWRSDGTESGTKMLKDIRVNDRKEYYEPNNLFEFKGKLFFAAKNDTTGYELWTSDGTESGTLILKDINSNENAGSNPSSFFVFNDALYFIANDGLHWAELWTSDGTAEGTKMLMNINESFSGFGYGEQFLTLNDHFYFFADDGVHGSEFWKSDGTAEGTKMVKDICEGYRSSSHNMIGVSLDSTIIFVANDRVNGNEIWTSDGTEAGTKMIKNIDGTNYSSLDYSNILVKYNNFAYFLAKDSVHGTEIWKTNGTADGTTLLKDINEGSESVWLKQIYVDEDNNRLLFFVNDQTFSNRRLWVSNGSSVGTYELSKLEDSNRSGVDANFVTINNKTFLTGENEKYGNELWVTDGTKSGTSLFADLNYTSGSSPEKFTNVNDVLFFKARGVKDGEQLYKSDGTPEGTLMVKNIHPGYGFTSDYSDMKDINGSLFFYAFDGEHGMELWRTNGTDEGTIMVKDIYPGSKGSRETSSDSRHPLAIINDIIYFSADDGVHGLELWRSDGTEAGTYMIKDLRAGSAGSYVRSFVLYNGVVYFIEGYNLWKTDGTESGTEKIIRLNQLSIIKVINDRLVMVAETSGTTYGPHDLWVSDGTASGTCHLKSYGDNIDSSIDFTAELKDELFFVAKDPDVGYKGVFKTDGTVEGTANVFDGGTHPTISNIDIDNILTCGSYVYFGVENNYGDVELWRSDGVNTECIIAYDSENYTFIRNLTCLNENLFFLKGSNCKEIWFINDGLDEPQAISINVINGPNLEGNDCIEAVGATTRKLFIKARNDKSGSELYIATPDFFTTTSTQDPVEVKEELIHIYPNPANYFVHVKSQTPGGIAGLELYNSSGSKIHRQSYGSYTKEIKYDVSSLYKGVYFMKIYAEDNKVSYQKLIVN